MAYRRTDDTRRPFDTGLRQAQSLSGRTVHGNVRFWSFADHPNSSLPLRRKQIQLLGGRGQPRAQVGAVGQRHRPPVRRHQERPQFGDGNGLQVRLLLLT